MQLCLLFCNNRIFSRRSRQHRISVLRRVLSPAFAGGSFSSVYEKSSVICEYAAPVAALKTDFGKVDNGLKSDRCPVSAEEGGVSGDR